MLKNPLFKEGVLVFLGQVGAFLGSLFGLKIMTHFLPREVFGQFNLLTVAMVLPGWILFAPFLHAAIRMYAPSRESGETPLLLRTSLVVQLCLTGIVALVGLAVYSSGAFERTWISPLVFGLVLAQFISDIWQAFGIGICGAARLRKRVAVISVFMTWSRPLFAIVFLAIMGTSVAAVLTAYFLASILMLPIAYAPFLTILRDGRGWISKDLLRRMAAYGTPIALWSTFAWGQSYIDRYVLEFNLGASVVGTYAAAYQVAAFPFVFFMGFLNQFISPIVFELVGGSLDSTRLAAGKNFVHWNASLFATLGAVIVLGYALFGSSIMQLLTHTDYMLPNNILAILAGGALVQNLAQVLATSIFAHNRPYLLFWAVVVPGLLSLPLSWSLVHFKGIFGAACANAAASFTFLLMVLWMLYILAHPKRGYFWRNLICAGS